MAEVQTKNLTTKKWADLSLMEQMGNVGSEVGRAISWQKRNNNEYKEKAVERALVLIDLTINDSRWVAKFRLKEILRAREVLADYFYGDNFYRSSTENLEKYFYHFAFAARKMY